MMAALLRFRLVPMLKSKCREAKSMASFHFAMESAIKKDNGKLPELQEIGAVDSLKVSSQGAHLHS